MKQEDQTKYQVGTKWLMRNGFCDSLEAEVIQNGDQRLEKLVMPWDVCLFFPRFNVANTYDESFLDTCCEPLKLSDGHTG